MYHRIEDQEKNPNNYALTKVDPTMTEDECFDFLSKPRQTQKTVGLYLKKLKEPGIDSICDQKPNKEEKKRLSLYPQTRHEERELMRNKGFWVEKPQTAAPLTYKLVEKYTSLVPVQPKKSTEPRAKSETLNIQEEPEPPDAYFSNRIPIGCQCSTYGEHNSRIGSWDFPFSDEVDMIRQHEMNKVMKPYKWEILRANYTESPPIKLVENHFGMKRKFPIYDISNL